MEHLRGEIMLQAATGGIAGRTHETDRLIRVLFDSFSQPAFAATRSTPMGSMSIREVVYRAEPYQIDIQVEVQAERNRLVVTGSCSTSAVRRWSASMFRSHSRIFGELSSRR